MTDDGTQEYSAASVQPSGTDWNENTQKRWLARLQAGREQLMADADGRDFTPLEEIDQQIDFWKSVGDDTFLPDLEAKRARLVAEGGAGAE